MAINDLTKLKRWVVFLYLASGACSLVYQVVWQRLLKLTIGNTTIATSVTVATFLGGLALGSYLIRKRVDAVPHKLKAYAWLEVSVAILSLLSPWLLYSVDGLYVFAHQSLAYSPNQMLALQIVFSGVILIVPTVLMGATLPLLSVWLVSSASQTGHWVGKLYSLNIFGAALGCAVSGFFSIRWFGVHETLFMASALNLVVAGVAFRLSKADLPQPPEPQNFSERRAKEIDDPATRRLILILLFSSGFVALGYEIVWMRTIVHFLRAEIYVFTAVLAVYLFGYACGAMVGSKVLRRGPNPILWFSQSFAWVGVYGAVYVIALASIGSIGGGWFRGVIPVLAQQPSFVLHLFYSLILFTLPSFLMGLGFPFLIQCWRRYYDRTGATVSIAYSLNAIGCVAGSLLTGLVLIPHWGAQWTSNLLGLMAITLGCWACLRVPHMFAKVLPFAGLVVAFSAMVLVPKDAYLQWINRGEGRGEKVELVDAVEGINTTASVHHYLQSDTYVISSAGVNVAGDQSGLRTIQKVQAHIPVLLHGNPKDILTVGFGSGELSKTLELQGIPNISVVEVAPEMVQMAKKHFKHINLGDEIEKRLKITYMDPKNYTHLTNGMFDIIMNDSIWPGSFAESSSLYTKEYFLEGKKHLRDDGLYSTWLPISIPEKSLFSILKTFNDVFANMTVWYPHNSMSKHLLLVGQVKPHKYSYSAMQKRFEQKAIKESLRYLNVTNVNDVIDFLFTDGHGVERLVASAEENSDYYPVVEFDVDRLRQTDFMLQNFSTLRDKTPRARFVDEFSFDDLSIDDQQTILGRLQLKQQSNEYLFNSYMAKDYWAAVQEASKGLEINPGDADLTAQLNRLYSVQPPPTSP